MSFVDLDIGDIFLSWYDDTMYMKIPTCEVENKIYNAIYMFGTNRGHFAYFEPNRGVVLHDEVNTLK